MSAPSPVTRGAALCPRQQYDERGVIRPAVSEVTNDASPNRESAVMFPIAVTRVTFIEDFPENDPLEGPG